ADRGLPPEPRRSRASRTPATLPLPEGQQAAQPAAAKPSEKLATPIAGTPDPRLGLGRAPVRPARRARPLEGRPGRSRAAGVGQRTDLRLSLSQRAGAPPAGHQLDQQARL